MKHGVVFVHPVYFSGESPASPWISLPTKNLCGLPKQDSLEAGYHHVTQTTAS